MPLRMLLITVTLFIITLSFGNAQPNGNTVLFRDRDSLTLFVPPGAPVSLEGLTFEVTASGTRSVRTLTDYTSLVGLPFEAVPTPICLRLARNETTIPVPTECQTPGVALFVQNLTSADVFWLDSTGAELIVTIGGGVQPINCPPQNPRCEFTYLPATEANMAQATIAALETRVFSAEATVAALQTTLAAPPVVQATAAAGVQLPLRYTFDRASEADEFEVNVGALEVRGDDLYTALSNGVVTTITPVRFQAQPNFYIEYRFDYFSTSALFGFYQGDIANNSYHVFAASDNGVYFYDWLDVIHEAETNPLFTAPPFSLGLEALNGEYRLWVNDEMLLSTPITPYTGDVGLYFLSQGHFGLYIDSIFLQAAR